MAKLKDYLIDNPMEVITGICRKCEGTGYITKDEWVGTDDSYEVEIKCQCKED